MKRLFFTWTFLFLGMSLYAQPQKVWLDADTGNELDDVFAIIRLLCEPSVEVAGLSSAHFNNPDLLVYEKWNQYDTQDIHTVRISQELNEEILQTMGRGDILCPLGADRQIGRAWGGYEPQESKAVEQLVATVKSLPNGAKLDVLCLGALTNIASAIILYPEIIPQIRCYALGAGYHPQTGAWNKNEFNIRNDLNAFDYLLNKEDFEFYIMPISTALGYVFDRDETYAKIDPADPVTMLIKKRWEETFPGDKNRIIWDLALVEAYLKPALCQLEQVMAPPENTQRKVNVYTQIDHEGMTRDFWEYVTGKNRK
ncbi:MAG: nucleoside hydrolase [Tannerellaceae bacterium]|nr:nucleoside hydrolase [Tannerellaceae bacterium]